MAPCLWRAPAGPPPCPPARRGGKAHVGPHLGLSTRSVLRIKTTSKALSSKRGSWTQELLLMPLKIGKVSNIIYLFLFLKTNLFIIFIYFWLHWVFVAARGFSLVAASGGYSLLWCSGFSSQWILLLRSTGSRRIGFRSCGTRAQ